uniref:Uncharacterized protein n=1 Tax=Avena sativa TaxID=4498 RepID=A0ACD5ZDU9_AVESA
MFPEGMRVLAVDDDHTCLRILEGLLRRCNYEPTVVSDARTALEMLREEGGEQFDLVLTDVHMPNMDGFRLLELIGLEMDLPVIMMSVDSEKDSVYKGIAHGACDYLLKPINIKDLTNIWQHVVRKNLDATNHTTNESDDDDERVVPPTIVEGERGGSKGKKCAKKMKNDEDGSDENIESTHVPTTRKRPRVSWNGELHRRFLAVVNRLGADRAYPKTILKMMNVENLTRASVASHLQKYRIYLKRVSDDSRKSYLPGESGERRRWSNFMNMNHECNLNDHHEHHRGQPSSALGFQGSNNLMEAPLSVLGALGHGGSTLRNAVPWMPDTRRCHACVYGPPVNPFPKISDHTKLDAFSSRHYDQEYANFLRENMSKERQVVPCSHRAGNCFANMPNSGVLEPVNQFPVQPPEVLCKNSAVGERRDTQFMHHVGNSSIPWQNIASSRFPGPMDGAPLIPSQVNNHQMNQQPSFGTLPGHMQIFQNEQQNQMAGIISNNTPLAGFNEQMATFNIASNTTLVERASDNFSPMNQMVSGGSSSSIMRNVQTGSSVVPPTQMVNGGSMSIALGDLQGNSVAPTQMLNGEEASRILPAQEVPPDQQALDDQPTYSIPFFQEDIFASLPNQDFNDDAFFGGDI